MRSWQRRSKQNGRSYDFSPLIHVDILPEPIAPSTLQRMADNGIPSGAINQSYGIAECVARVISRGKGVDSETGIHSSGEMASLKHLERHVDIVDERSDPVEDGIKWNILVTGPGIVPGYWGNKALSKETIHVKINVKDLSSDLRWLKTGDLGYIKNGQLYANGRSKELILIKGRNDATLRPGCVCAGQLDSLVPLW